MKKAKLIRLKIITMGNSATGKSCIVKRYCEERFISKYISTIGIDYGVKPTVSERSEASELYGR